MPTITLNATNNQAAKIDEARVAYNQIHGTTLNTKPFIYEMLRQAVQGILAGQADAAAETAAQSVRNSIDTAMGGGT